MLGVYRLVLLASVCTALVLAGCAPIQPESQASPSQNRPQSAMEPTATSMPDPTDPPTTAARKPPDLPTAVTPEPPVLPTATEPESPAPAAITSRPDAPSSDYWLVYVDDARGLSIFYPPEWVLFDPTKTELAELVEKLGEKANSDEIKELLETFTQAIQQEDLFVGMGFQFPTGSSRDTRFVNNVNIISFHTEGLFLQLIAQMIAAQLDSLEGIQVDSAEVVAGLRPNGAEVASVRYRSKGALFNQPDLEIIGWQVGVLSPEAERIVVLTFSIRSEDFAELEPLLTEIVQRVQWLQ
ncbi:MAG: hypothetical protein OXI80_22220 [Caldilineaceae bacterium]|nr:hypothetical protein [Caldilineaceae bacterium]MDE0340400.1 hypothetical protein [Caldilineaceae bacterium]